MDDHQPRDRELEHLRARATRLERELEQIHRSKMWRLWMFSIGLRRWIVGGPARALGLAYLGAHYAWNRLLAGLRAAPAIAADPPPTELGRRLRLLIVMPYHIVPPDHGGGTRLYNLCRELGARCDLHLLIFSRTGEDPEQRRALEPWCREVFFHHWTPAYHPDLFGLRPIPFQFFFDPEVGERLRRIVGEHRIDAVQLEYAELGQYIGAVPPGVPVTLTEHDVAFASHRRRRALSLHERFAEGALHRSTLGDWLALFRAEIRACRTAHAVHAMSATDATVLGACMGSGAARILVVPNGVDVDHYRPPDDLPPRRDVLFVGNFENHPNLDGVEFFTTEAWPLIRGQQPHCRLRLVGAFADQRLGHLHGHDGISVQGRVPDLRPEYHGHRVMVAPIRAGSGTRLKILEAMAAGTPVVSTSIGCEGLEVTPGVHCLVADDGPAMAAAVVRILTDDGLADSVAVAARELVASRYDWGPIAERIVASHSALVAHEGPPQP